MTVRFFQDRQINRLNSSLVYYVDADRMCECKDNCVGLRIIARPDKGFAHYAAGEFRSEGIPVSRILTPNETTYVEILLNRRINRKLFTFGKASVPPASFKGTRPSGETLDN